MPSNKSRPGTGPSPSDASEIAHTLVSEAHHRISNNLQVIVGLVRLHASRIGRQAGPIPPDDTRALLEEVAGRVAAIGLLHQRLAATVGGATVDIDALVRDICERLGGVMSQGGQPALRVTGTSCAVPAGTAVPVALIVNELVTNAVKFAHHGAAAGAVKVDTVLAPDGALVIEVTDDGPGLPDGFDPAGDGGLGFQVMRALAGQLGAALVFESAAPGLRARLSVPRERL